MFIVRRKAIIIPGSLAVSSSSLLTSIIKIIIIIIIIYFFNSIRIATTSHYHRHHFLSFSLSPLSSSPPSSSLSLHLHLLPLPLLFFLFLLSLFTVLVSFYSCSLHLLFCFLPSLGILFLFAPPLGLNPAGLPAPLAPRPPPVRSPIQRRTTTPPGFKHPSCRDATATAAQATTAGCWLLRVAASSPLPIPFPFSPPLSNFPFPVDHAIQSSIHFALSIPSEVLKLVPCLGKSPKRAFPPSSIHRASKKVARGG